MPRILNDTLHGPVIVIIPAKISSQGVTRKFEVPILGKPAILWSVEAALDCPDVTEVWIMQNHPDVGKLVRKLLSDEQNKRVKVVMDPPQDVSMDEKVYGLLVKNEVKTDSIIVLSQPTTPLVRPKHISAAIAMWRSQPLGVSVLSGQNCAKFRWNRARRQKNLYHTRDYDPRERPLRQQRGYIFLEDGALYVSSAALWYATRCRLGSATTIYPLAAHYSLEIDEPDDVLIVRAVAEFLYGEETVCPACGWSKGDTKAGDSGRERP